MFANRPYGSGNMSFGNFNFGPQYYPTPKQFIANPPTYGFDFKSGLPIEHSYTLSFSISQRPMAGYSHAVVSADLGPRDRPQANGESAPRPPPFHQVAHLQVYPDRRSAHPRAHPRSVGGQVLLRLRVPHRANCQHRQLSERLLPQGLRLP